MSDLNEPGTAQIPDNSAYEQPNKSNSSQFVWEGISETDTKYIDGKGWKAPADVLKSYQELEKAYSGKISLPKDGDEEAWKNLYSKLGKPESADKYEIEGVDEKYKAELQQIFFKNNILPKDVNSLVADYNKFIEAHQAALDDFSKENSQREFDEVIAEWGDDADKNKEIAKRGARLLGLDDDTLNVVEQAIGTKQFLKSMMKLGQAISEDSINASSPTGKDTKAPSLEDFYKQL